MCFKFQFGKTFEAGDIKTISRHAFLCVVGGFGAVQGLQECRPSRWQVSLAQEAGYAANEAHVAFGSCILIPTFQAIGASLFYYTICL